MATSKDKQNKKTDSTKIATAKSQLKKQTVREKAEKAGSKNKPRRIQSAGARIAKPFKKVAQTGKKEYYLPMPDNKAGRFLNKRRRFIPRYFREAWAEVKLVVWPGRKETLKLTFAVFIFASFFATFVSVIDFALDKLFKKLIF